MRWLLIPLAVNCAGPIGIDFQEKGSTDKNNLEKQAITKPPSVQHAFRDHVWPELKRSCGRCHADKHTPFFASTNIDKAREAIIDGGKVDFTDVANSRLVLRLNKDNHNCPDDCVEDANRFIKVLTLWKKNTEAQQIDGLKTIDLNPATDLTPTDGSLNYDLSNIQIDNQPLEGQLVVEIAPLSRGRGYLLNNLRLETSERLFVRVIKPLINDRWNSLNTTFLQLKCAIDPPGGRLQGRGATTIVADNLLTTNKLSFVFEELRLATDDDSSCRDDGQSVPQPSEPPTATQRPITQKQTDFIADIYPIMVESCREANCHTTTNRGYLFNYRRAWQRRTAIDQRITTNDANLRMPPDASDKELSDNDRNTLLDWLVD